MNKLIIIITALIVISACKKDRFEPEPPVISFGGWKYYPIGANGHDSLVEMVINFKDRNGDIGRIESDSYDKCGIQINDLYIYYEKKENGVYSPAYETDPDNPLDSSLDANCIVIPGSYIYSKQIDFKRAVEFIQPEGNNQSIEGEIIYKLNYESALSRINTFPAGRCKVFLMDRARNKSNEFYTEDLIIH